MKEHDISGRPIPPKKPRIAFLIVAASLSAAIAWGFFMDPIVVAGLGALGLPPPRIQLPEWNFSELMGGGEEQTDTDPNGEGTKKPWWDELFDGIKPGLPDEMPPVEPDLPAVEEPTMSLDTLPSYEVVEPSLLYYTQEEMLEAYYDPLVNALVYLAAEEKAGMIAPIEGVGLFDLDVNGVPEVITVLHADGYAQYHVYELYSVEELSSWWLESSDFEELALWQSYSSLAKTGTIDSYYPSSSSYLSSSSIAHWITFRTLIMYDGNSGVNCVGEITRNRMTYEELFAQDSSAVMNGIYRVNGTTVDEKAYYEAYEQFKELNEPMTETAMVTVAWETSRPERMVKMLLTSEQQFLNMGK